ncbi:MAG: hypothetical protein OEW57_00720 [Gammaproteobacteria bacterium]|nr:hypothetical protein [Gammaproteobacteria bacterium]
MIGQVDESTAEPLAAILNQECQCIWVDRAKLRDQLRANLGDAGSLLESQAGLVSGSVVFLAPGEAASMGRTVRLITHALTSYPYQQKIALHAPELARRPQAAAGGVLGFDFHLGGPTPQLIEINTNPGGLLVNLELARAATASCDCFAEPISLMTAAGVAIDQLGQRITDGFQAEWTSARGEVPLRAIAIVDDEPQGQYLFPEFLLYQRLLERAGWRVLIADAASLTIRGDAVYCADERIDLIYNRATDFYLADERHAVLHSAYESDLAVLTPHPAAHARWADKRLLAWLGDEKMLQEAGLGADDRSHLRQTIPATEVVEPAAADDLWQRRKSLFFKPVDGFGSKAAYRGDKLTRTMFDHTLAHRYVAQAIAPTSFRRVSAVDGAATDLRVDVRNYVMHGETWLRAARLYRGQTTNFRTAGGGFAPVLTLPI